MVSIKKYFIGIDCILIGWIGLRLSLLLVAFWAPGCKFIKCKAKTIIDVINSIITTHNQSYNQHKLHSFNSNY